MQVMANAGAFWGGDDGATRPVCVGTGWGKVAGAPPMRPSNRRGARTENGAPRQALKWWLIRY